MKTDKELKEATEALRRWAGGGLQERVVRSYGTPQTKEYCFWSRVLDRSVLTIRIPLLPRWIRQKIGNRLHEIARF